MQLIQMNEIAQFVFHYRYWYLSNLSMTEFFAPPQCYILASNEKYSYIGACVFIHRLRSLLQLSDTTVKTSDGVVLAFNSYCRLLVVK